MDNFKDNETDIQHLIISSLEGTASEEELLVLQKWLEESEQHFLLFHAYRQDWIQAGCVQRYQTGEAWKKVERRLFHRMPVKHLFLWTRIAGYAALVVLMIAVGYVFMRRDQDKNRAYVVEGNIEPGGKKAILVLGSDEKVVLGDEAEETLLAGNTTVKKEGNTLVYGEKHAKETAGEYNRLITPRGGEYAVVLADGTKVWLNSETRLEYPLAFGEHSREVRLSGEAYFEVTKDEARCFNVIMEGATIEVMGTSFNASCYPGEGQCWAVLESGKINLRTDHGVAAVNVGECASCDIASGKVTVETVDLKYFTSWRYGTFYFYNTPLSEIVQKLGRWYDVHFKFADESLRDVCFSGAALRSKPIDFMLELLSSTQSLKFDIQSDGMIMIYKK